MENKNWIRTTSISVVLIASIIGSVFLVNNCATFTQYQADFKKRNAEIKFDKFIISSLKTACALGKKTEDKDYCICYKMVLADSLIAKKGISEGSPTALVREKSIRLCMLGEYVQIENDLKKSNSKIKELNKKINVLKNDINIKKAVIKELRKK